VIALGFLGVVVNQYRDVGSYEFDLGDNIVGVAVI
jgi:hypothetical protein